jgi:hypothetical protein
MKRDLALWIGVLAGPIVWLSAFEARFALAPWTCISQNKFSLYVVAVITLILCAASAVLSWTQWKALGEAGPSPEGGATPRRIFMAIGGMVLSIGCLLITLAQAIPEVMLGACE